MAEPVQHLIQSASQGDGNSLEKLLVRYLPDLRAFFRMRMGPRISAREHPSDLVQSVCREVLQDLSDFEGGQPEDFRRWLFLMAYRKMSNKNRFHGQKKRTSDREEAAEGDRTTVASPYVDLISPSRVAMGGEAAQAFDAAFDALPEEWRMVITSSKLLGLSNQEIAIDLGKSEAAVRMLLNRALARVGMLLEKHLGSGRDAQT